MHKNKILIIDSDEENRRFLIILLITEDFDIDFAANGHEAIKKFETNEYGVILCDIHLPDINGLELLKKIKRINPHIEAIMLSHKNNVAEAVNTLRLGAFDYLIKPFENIDLITNSVNKALESFTIKKHNQALIAELRSTNKNLEHLIEQKTASLTQSNQELKAANQSLIRLQDTLLEERKLSALGSITAGFAHEINNPIQNIMIYSELLMTDLATDSPDYNFAQIINQEVQRIEIITDKILNFSRKSNETDCQPINLKNFFNELFRENQKKIENRELHVSNLCHDNHYIICDRNEFIQIFINLLNNALDATSAGGEITVVSEKNIDQVAISFIDTGTGIPKDLQSRIFEPFFTTKDTGKGTGLGLYITYHLIKKNKGNITLEHSSAGGTTFKITFN